MRYVNKTEGLWIGRVQRVYQPAADSDPEGSIDLLDHGGGKLDRGLAASEGEQQNLRKEKEREVGITADLSSCFSFKM